MKTIILVTSLLLGLACCRSKSGERHALDITSIPPIDLLMTDSLSTFNTRRIPSGNYTILMYFSPDCEHCQRQTSALVKNITNLQNVNIFLLTPMPLADLKAFCDSFKLSNYANIIAGMDYKYAFYKYFKATAFPCTAIYDRNKQLVKLYREEIAVERILNSIHG